MPPSNTAANPSLETLLLSLIKTAKSVARSQDEIKEQMQRYEDRQCAMDSKLDELLAKFNQQEVISPPEPDFSVNSYQGRQIPRPFVRRNNKRFMRKIVQADLLDYIVDPNKEKSDDERTTIANSIKNMAVPIVVLYARLLANDFREQGKDGYKIVPFGVRFSECTQALQNEAIETYERAVYRRHKIHLGACQSNWWSRHILAERWNSRFCGSATRRYCMTLVMTTRRKLTASMFYMVARPDSCSTNNAVFESHMQADLEDLRQVVNNLGEQRYEHLHHQ